MNAITKWLARGLLSGLLMIVCGPVSAQSFCFRPPGVLLPPGSGQGRVDDRTIYIPDLAFPLSVGPASGRHAYLNSQIYGFGGNHGPSGNTPNDPRNYGYCWADTYCEGQRSWPMPLCPAKRAHQGVDIRPEGPNDDHFEAIAFANGKITQITRNTTVIVHADDGTVCRYLHLHPDSLTHLKIGQAVEKGRTVIGRVSNWMKRKKGGTSIHLHFDCRQVVAIEDTEAEVYIPVYTSLILAYAKIWNIPLQVAGDELLPGSPQERP
jgi:murein DD-endopeptidase MepM/ murein hydrolase activator NlpD